MFDAQSTQVLHDMLLFKRNALEQLVIVSTVFGVSSVDDPIALLVAPTRDKVRSFLLVILAIASLSFIFGTALDAIMLSAMHRDEKGLNATMIRGFLISVTCRSGPY